MTFDETWNELMGDAPANEMTPGLRRIAFAFYTAGEVAGVMNIQAIARAAFSAGEQKSAGA